MRIVQQKTAGKGTPKDGYLDMLLIFLNIIILICNVVIGNVLIEFFQVSKNMANPGLEPH